MSVDKIINNVIENISNFIFFLENKTGINFNNLVIKEKVHRILILAILKILYKENFNLFSYRVCENGIDNFPFVNIQLTVNETDEDDKIKMVCLFMVASVIIIDKKEFYDSESLEQQQCQSDALDICIFCNNNTLLKFSQILTKLSQTLMPQHFHFENTEGEIYFKSANDIVSKIKILNYENKDNFNLNNNLNYDLIILDDILTVDTIFMTNIFKDTILQDKIPIIGFANKN